MQSSHAAIGRKETLGDWTLPSYWALKHRVIRSKPLQFVSDKDLFRHRRWSVGPLDDPHPSIVIKKARQLGLTELNLGMRMLYFSSLVSSMSVFALPTWKKAEEFARERLNPLGVAGSASSLSELMRERLVDWTKTLTFKHIRPAYGGGMSTIQIVSAGNTSLGESTAADACYLDEYDQ